MRLPIWAMCTALAVTRGPAALPVSHRSHQDGQPSCTPPAPTGAREHCTLARPEENPLRHWQGGVLRLTWGRPLETALARSRAQSVPAASAVRTVRAFPATDALHNHWFWTRAGINLFLDRGRQSLEIRGPAGSIPKAPSRLSLGSIPALKGVPWAACYAPSRQDVVLLGASTSPYENGNLDLRRTPIRYWLSTIRIPDATLLASSEIDIAQRLRELHETKHGGNVEAVGKLRGLRHSFSPGRLELIGPHTIALGYSDLLGLFSGILLIGRDGKWYDAVEDVDPHAYTVINDGPKWWILCVDLNQKWCIWSPRSARVSVRIAGADRDTRRLAPVGEGVGGAVMALAEDRRGGQCVVLDPAYKVKQRIRLPRYERMTTSYCRVDGGNFYYGMRLEDRRIGIARLKIPGRSDR